MRILKSNPLLSAANHYVIDSPQPSNISYWWNIGSLLGLSLMIQIITGVTLAMHYNPNVTEAFNSVEHIMRDVNNGWLIRYMHSNTASAFFFLVYLHIGRGLYYGSYKGPRTLTWTIGTIIFILMMATAFLGYKYSPKWYKFNRNSTTININVRKTLGFSSSEKINKFITNSNYLTKRQYSTSKPIISGLSSTVKNFIEEKNITPCYVYENLGNEIIRNQMRQNLKNLSGVYLILNKVNLDYYIGSASTGKFNNRVSNHLFNFNGSKLLKNAVKKYGLSKFVFLVLELFPELVNKDNNKQLLDLEDFYLKSLIPNYNILTEAGSSFGYKHTETTRIKMKSNYSEKRRLAIGNINKGIDLSENAINLVKEKSNNIIKPIYLGESIYNMKKKSKGILAYNLDLSIYGQYTSIVDTARAFNVSTKTVYRALKSSNNLLKKRWIVNYM